MCFNIKKIINELYHSELFKKIPYGTCLNFCIKYVFFSIDLPDILNNPVVKAIAAKHKKTEAQIVLRHAIQKEIVVIPKSTNPKRLRENIDIFGFELDGTDMDQLNNLDQGVRILNFAVFKG